MLSASRSLRPSHTRLGRGLMKGLPVWFGAVKITGCPVEKTVIAVAVHPLIAMSAQPPDARRRPNGNSQTALSTARCLTSKLVGPLEHSRQIVIWLPLELEDCQESDSAFAK